MSELTEFLAPDPPVEWFIGKVSALTGDTVSVTYWGGTITKVGVVDQYIPAVNDVVHGLMWGQNGAIIFGSNNSPASPPTPPAAGAVTIIAGATKSSYVISAATWLGVAVNEADPDLYRAWFWPAGSFSALAGTDLAKFEVEVTQTAGNALQFVAASNLTATGPYVPLDDYLAPASTPSVATFVTLPLDWGQQIIAGTMKSIALGGGQYPSTLTGTGRLRFTGI